MGGRSTRVSTEEAAALAPLVKKLWPEHTEAELTRILREYAASVGSAVFAYRDGGRTIGMAICRLRHDYVEGCETSPVGYLEGIYVEERYRCSGIAGSLVRECEAWAREQGCSEFASDCELTNADSLRFHLGVGFEEANRIICFRKEL